MAFEAVGPLIEKKEPKLIKEIEADFAAVYAALKPTKQKRGPASSSTPR